MDNKITPEYLKKIFNPEGKSDEEVIKEGQDLPESVTFQMKALAAAVSEFVLYGGPDLTMFIIGNLTRNAEDAEGVAAAVIINEIYNTVREELLGELEAQKAAKPEPGLDINAFFNLDDKGHIH